MPAPQTALFYEIEGDGPWVIFAHGGDGNHLCWHRQVAAQLSSGETDVHAMIVPVSPTAQPWVASRKTIA